MQSLKRDLNYHFIEILNDLLRRRMVAGHVTSRSLVICYMHVAIFECVIRPCSHRICRIHQNVEGEFYN